MKNCLDCGASAEDDVATCAECGRPFASREPVSATMRPQRQLVAPASGLLTCGWVLLLLGVAIAIGALFISTSVEIADRLDLPSLGASIPTLASHAVYNLGKLHARDLVFVTGCTLFLAGIVLIAAATAARAVISSLRPAATREPAPAAEPKLSHVKPWVP